MAFLNCFTKIESHFESLTEDTPRGLKLLPRMKTPTKRQQRSFRFLLLGNMVDDDDAFVVSFTPAALLVAVLGGGEREGGSAAIVVEERMAVVVEVIIVGDIAEEFDSSVADVDVLIFETLVSLLLL